MFSRLSLLRLKSRITPRKTIFACGSIAGAATIKIGLDKKFFSVGKQSVLMGFSDIYKLNTINEGETPKQSEAALRAKVEAEYQKVLSDSLTYAANRPKYEDILENPMLILKASACDKTAHLKKLEETNPFVFAVALKLLASTVYEDPEELEMVLYSIPKKYVTKGFYERVVATNIGIRNIFYFRNYMRGDDSPYESISPTTNDFTLLKAAFDKEEDLFIKNELLIALSNCKFANSTDREIFLASIPPAYLSDKKFMDHLDEVNSMEDTNTCHQIHHDISSGSETEWIGFPDGMAR